MLLSQNFENLMQLPKFHQKLQNQEFGWLWKRWGRHIFVEGRLLNVKERKEWPYATLEVFGNVFDRRESKCCVVLMKNCCKVKGEQVITL